MGATRGVGTDDDSEDTRPETIDQTTAAAPLAGDDREDEFAQRVHAWDSLNTLMPGLRHGRRSQIRPPLAHGPAAPGPRRQDRGERRSADAPAHGAGGGRDHVMRASIASRRSILAWTGGVAAAAGPVARGIGRRRDRQWRGRRRHFMRLHDAFKRADALALAAGDRFDEDRRSEALEAEADRLEDLADALLFRLVDTPALSASGILRKIELAYEPLQGGSYGGVVNDLLASAIRDLAGLADRTEK